MIISSRIRRPVLGGDESEEEGFLSNILYDC